MRIGISIFSKSVLWCVLFANFAAAQDSPRFQIKGNAILLNQKPVIVRGVNAMNIFGVKDPMYWPGTGIVREFVGDLKNAPLKADETYRDQKHHWTLHGLQGLVDANRKRGLVTILCACGWDAFAETEFSGKTPMASPWYDGYKARMREWVSQFKGQPDVWIEVINEPFKPLTSIEDENCWLATMVDMVDNLRSAGWDGIILVPGSGWGQDEAVIEKLGPQLFQGRRDLLFDVHIYNRWLDHPESIPERCARIKASGLPFIFAELGPGSGPKWVRDARPFIKAALENHFSVLAWGWGTWGPRHPINLELNNGDPNNVGNYNWGTSFKEFLASPH